ncbi:MAG: hypothetical protein ACRDYA_15675 [Egibacteraceae bacterium]
MSDSHHGTDRLGRRRKRFLTPAQKYEIWVQLLRRETTIAAVAAPLDSHAALMHTSHKTHSRVTPSQAPHPTR